MLGGFQRKYRSGANLSRNDNHQTNGKPILRDPITALVLAGGFFPAALALASRQLRRLTENLIPDCAGYLFVLKEWQPAHSSLCRG